MFFNNFIKRILSSLVRPWLEQDLDLDLHLGFINSIATAKNIRLDTSALNRQIIDGSTSPHLIFKEFVIEEFIVRFSNWSDSAFSFEARGVKVTLSFEEMDEDDIAKASNSSNAALESLKKDLSKIDPEILDINLQVQFPVLGDSFVCLLDLEKLNAESLHFVHGSLCRGLVTVVFLPLKEGSFVISASSFKIGYKKSNQIS